MLITLLITTIAILIYFLYSEKKSKKIDIKSIESMHEYEKSNLEKKIKTLKKIQQRQSSAIFFFFDNIHNFNGIYRPEGKKLNKKEKATIIENTKILQELFSYARHIMSEEAIYDNDNNFKLLISIIDDNLIKIEQQSQELKLINKSKDYKELLSNLQILLNKKHEESYYHNIKMLFELI